MNNGMTTLKWYGTFDTSDVFEFEAALRAWIQRNGKDSNLIFDDSNLKRLRCKLRNQEKGVSNGMAGIICRDFSEETKSMLVQTLTIEWYTIRGTKSILKSVTDLDGNILYEDTQQWKNTEFWYAF